MDCSRTLSLLALAVVVGAPVPSGAGRTTGDASQLLRVVTPVTGRTVPAHPFVNVVVRTGAGPADPVDPRSFRAHLGGRSITRLFIPIVDDGAVVGMRALLGAALLARGDRLNHLRVEVRGRGKGRRASHAVAHVVFRTATAPDRAPRARLLVSSDLVSGGAPLQFDGTESDDPDLDTLAYRWDFGDGTTSSDPRPAHTYTTTAPSVTVRLTVSDGQLAASDRLTLLAAPALDPGRTPGVLAVDASQPLEFGGVAIGSQASLTFTVRNAGTAPTSQLKVALDACTHVWATGECDDGGPFALSTSSLDLGPGEAAPVELTFASAAGGHRSAQVTLVASASNAGAVHLLAHANGGPGSGPGPLPAASTLFFGSEVAPIEASLPGGERLAIDDVLGGCTVPQNGPGSGDACVVDADCGAHGGRCGGTGACVGGARPGDACAAPEDVRAARAPRSRSSTRSTSPATAPAASTSWPTRATPIRTRTTRST